MARRKRSLPRKVMRYALGSGRTQEDYVRAVQRAKQEINDDIEAGIVPHTVRSFGELHDHVDANGYGGAFEDPNLSGDLIDTDNKQFQDSMDFWNRVHDEVHHWLRRGRRESPPRRLMRFFDANGRVLRFSKWGDSLKDVYNQEFRRKAIEAGVDKSDEFHKMDHFGHILKVTRGNVDKASNIANDMLYEGEKGTLFDKYDPSGGKSLAGHFRSEVSASSQHGLPGERGKKTIPQFSQIGRADERNLADTIGQGDRLADNPRMALSIDDEYRHRLSKTPDEDIIKVIDSLVRRAGPDGINPSILRSKSALLNRITNDRYRDLLQKVKERGLVVHRKTGVNPKEKKPLHKLFAPEHDPGEYQDPRIEQGKRLADRVRAGETMEGIVRSDGGSNRQVRKLIDMAIAVGHPDPWHQKPTYRGVPAKPAKIPTSPRKQSTVEQAQKVLDAYHEAGGSRVKVQKLMGVPRSSINRLLIIARQVGLTPKTRAE